MVPASLPDASDFKRVFAGRQCRSNSAMTVYWAPPPEGSGGQRLGLVVSKSVGGAVVRNRLRRVLRAAFPQLAAELPSGDFAVVARPRLRAEYTIHVRGSLASATVDFERNTYTLDEHRTSDPDFESYGMVVSRARSLKQQARRTLATYIKAKLKLGKRGNPYGASIARALDAFYGAAPLDERVDGRFGARVIRVCTKLGGLANLPDSSEHTSGAKALVDAETIDVRAEARPVQRASD